ncbi:3462_t:CDS:10 [Entrophospora sp. SA101]|nr:3462_t:CDS:10 [Entrophospora sp. SA101]
MIVINLGLLWTFKIKPQETAGKIEQLRLDHSYNKFNPSSKDLTDLIPFKLHIPQKTKTKKSLLKKNSSGDYWSVQLKPQSFFYLPFRPDDNVVAAASTSTEETGTKFNHDKSLKFFKENKDWSLSKYIDHMESQLNDVEKPISIYQQKNVVKSISLQPLLKGWNESIKNRLISKFKVERKSFSEFQKEFKRQVDDGITKKSMSITTASRWLNLLDGTPKGMKQVLIERELSSIKENENKDNNKSTVGRFNSNNSNTSKNDTSNNADTTTKTTKARPTSIIKKGAEKVVVEVEKDAVEIDHSRKKVSLGLLEDDLKELLSSNVDINSIDSRDLVAKASTVAEKDPPNTAAAAIALLASRISALEDELETVGKEMVENIKREVDLELELDNMITQKDEQLEAATKPLVTRISQLEADLLQYTKTNSTSTSSRSSRDFFSDLNTPTNSATKLAENEERIKSELNERFVAEKDELIRSHYNEKELIETEIGKLIKSKNLLEKELRSIENNFKDEKNALRQEYEDEMNSLKQEYEVEISKLKETNLKSESFSSSLTLLNELREKKEKIEKEYDNLKAEHSKTLKEINLLNIKNQNSEKKFNDLKSQLKDKEKLEIEYGQLQLEFDEMKSGKDKLETRLEGLSDKFEEIKNINNNLFSTNIDQLMAKDEMINELNLEFDLKKKEIKTLKETFKNNSEKLNQELREEIKTLKDNYNKKVSELNKKQEALKELESSYNELKVKHQESQANSSKISRKLGDVENERELLEKDNQDLNEEKSQLIDEKQELIKEIERLKEEIQNSEEEKLALKSDLVEVQGAHKTVADVLKFMKVEWETQYQTLKAECNESQERIKELQELAESNNAKSNETNRLEEIIQDLQRQKKAQDIILDEHQKGMQTLMKDTASEREQWRQKEQDFIQSYESIELQMNQKESELNIIRDELENAIKDKKVMKEKLINVGREKVVADSDKKRIENELAKTLEEKRNLSSQLIDARRQLDRFKEQLKSIKIMEKNIERDNNNSNNELLSKQKQELDVLQQQLVSLNKQLSIKDDEQHDLIQTVEQLTLRTEQTAATYKSKISALQKQHEEELKSLTTDMQAKLESLEKKQKNQSLNSNNSRSSSKYHNENGNGNLVDIKKQLEKRVFELENSLESTKSEYNRLDEKLTQVEMKYLESVHEKGQLVEDKRNAERKIKSLEMKLENNNLLLLT